MIAGLGKSINVIIDKALINHLYLKNKNGNQSKKCLSREWILGIFRCLLENYPSNLKV